MGSPNPRERHGDRAWVVIREWESHLHGEARQGLSLDEGGMRNAEGQTHTTASSQWGETSLESRVHRNMPARFGKGEWETCQRAEYGNGECRFNRSRQPFWRRGNAPASYFMKRDAAHDEKETANSVGMALEARSVFLRKCGEGGGRANKAHESSPEKLRWEQANRIYDDPVLRH